MRHIPNSNRHPRPRKVELDFAYAGGRLYAGPSRYAGTLPTPLFRINLAQELKVPADLVVPTMDFGVPPISLFKHALREAGVRLLRGEAVYVGCGFGIGRTGTFIAALCKLNREVLWLTRRSRDLGDDAYTDPVEEARTVYLATAVETKAQEEFVRTLDVSRVARQLALRAKPSIVFDKRYWNSLLSRL